MRKFLFVLVVSVVSLAAGAAHAKNGYSVSKGRSGRNNQSQNVKRPTPYDYVARGYMEAYIDKHVGAGYGARAIKSVDAEYRAAASYSGGSGGYGASGVIIVPAGAAYTGKSGIKFSAPFVAQ